MMPLQTYKREVLALVRRHTLTLSTTLSKSTYLLDAEVVTSLVTRSENYLATLRCRGIELVPQATLDSTDKSLELSSSLRF